MTLILNRPLFLITLLVLFFGSVAQDKAHRFAHISVDKGLSQSTVFSITQDSYGFMWFGTRTGGLNRYDGRSFKVYKNDPKDPHSISGNEILSIFEDSKGRIWVGTRGSGLSRFDYEQERFYSYFNLSSPRNIRDFKTVYSVVEDNHGRIWMGSLGGLCLYDEEKDSFAPILNSITQEEFSGISSMTIMQDSLLCFGTKKGVHIINPNSQKVYKEFENNENNPHSLSDNQVISLLSDTKNRLWVGTRRNGLNLINDIANEKVIRFVNAKVDPNSLINNATRVIMEDQKGTIWVGTSGGLEELPLSEQWKTNPTFTHHKNDENDESSLSQNVIFSMFEDDKANLWIGTWSQGLNYVNVNSKKFDHFRYQKDKSRGLHNENITSFVEEDRGIWIGTDGGGLSLLDRKQNKFIEHLAWDTDLHVNRKNNIRSMYFDGEHGLWVGTSSGLLHYNLKSKKKNEFFKQRYINALVKGENNSLWVGTGKGLIRLDKKTFEYKIYKRDDHTPGSLADQFINFIHKDPNNQLWIGTKRGLHLYNADADNFTQFNHSPTDLKSLSNDNIVTIANDNQDNLWIGTYDGLNKFNPSDSTFIHISEADGLPDNVINGIVPGNKDEIWLSTNKGLVELTMFFKDNQDSLLIRHFTKEDGLQANEFIRHSQLKTSTGEILFGGIHGFNIFNPDNIKTNPDPPKVVLSDVRLFNESVHANDASGLIKEHVSIANKITLKPEQSIITFCFSALSYTSPEKNKFAYKLEGFEGKWNYVGSRNEATYTSLPAGTYTLKVKAANNDGIWNEDGISLKVVVLPPWWASWWFRIMATICILLVAFGIYLFRVRLLNKQKAGLERMVSLRTAELEASYHNVKTLSKIGEEITVSLSIEKIIEITYQQFHSMVDASYFAIGLYDESKEQLIFEHALSKGKPLPKFIYSLNDTTRLSVCSFISQQPILIHDLPNEYQKYLSTVGKHKVEGEEPLSLITLPLNVKDKKVGIISIQSPRKNAYTKYHQDILQNIAIYTAIALDNAYAYDKIEKQAHELININIELQQKQDQVEKQITELTMSEEELFRLNKELKTINGQLVNQQQELEDAIEQLKEAQSQLLHAEKMASIGVLTAGVAHEINNPLNFIRGGGLAIEDYVNNNLVDHVAKLGPLLEMIKSGISRASNIVNSLNRFNRKSDTKIEKCDLPLIIDNCFNILASSLKNRIQVHCDYSNEPNAVMGNEGELHQLFLNILTNAVQSIKESGTIKVKTLVENDFVVITTEDSGAGIRSEHIAKVTEPFFTTKDPGQGTGLGMSIVYSIVTSHKGEIQIDSEIDLGTQVTIKLPIKKS